ncbi:MAG: hypothetical protein HZA24_12075 [Nitrospirae bacterium]|nr:hypothetical protein [Nitrospirota bacterium]
MSDIIADETPAWYYRAQGFMPRQPEGPPWGDFVPPRPGGFGGIGGGSGGIFGGILGGDSGPVADTPREPAAQRGAVYAPAMPTAARDLLPPESIRRPDLAAEIPPYLRAPQPADANPGPFSRTTWFDLGAYSPRHTATQVAPQEAHFWDSLTHRGRAPKNVNLPPTADEVLASGWQRLPDYMSVLHDNGVGHPEQKFIFPDGREAVYDGDTGRLITDPRHAGTYNYVTPTIPSWNPLTWPETTARGVGHAVVDVLPYYIWGTGLP